MKKIELTKFDEKNFKTNLIAKGEIDNQNIIKITWTADVENSKLLEIINLLNQKNMMSIEIGTPPGQERYGSHSQVITRLSPDFFNTLCDYCLTYYDIQIHVVS